MALSSEAAARKDARNAGKTVMEHRHFAAIANIIKYAPWLDHRRKVTAEHFADELAATNPRFDRKRFLTACGVVED